MLQQFKPPQPIQPVRNYRYIDVEIGSIHPCSVSPIEHHTGPSQNTRAQKRKLEEILEEVPNHEFDNQLLCFELTTSLNSDEDVVKVMGADVPLAVQAQAFPELAGLYHMQ